MHVSPFPLPPLHPLKEKNQYPTFEEALISMPARVQLRKGSEAETKENKKQTKNIFHLRSHTTQVTFKGGRITMSFSKAQECEDAQVIIIKRLKWIVHFLKILRSLLIYK